MSANNKKISNHRKEVVISPRETNDAEKAVRSKNKHTKMSKKTRLQKLEIRQEEKSGLLVGERSNFRKLFRNQGSNKIEVSKKKKRSEEHIKVRSKSKKERKKGRSGMENSNSSKQESDITKEKSNSLKYKLKIEESEEGFLGELNNESDESSVKNEKDSLKGDFHDEALYDTPKKRLKQTFLPKERLQIPLLAAQYELEKPLKRLKSKIRGAFKSEQREGIRRKNSSASKSAGKESRRKAGENLKEKNRAEGTEMRLTRLKKVGIYTQNLYLESEVCLELHGIEIESVIEDYHSYAKEIKPEDLFIDLVAECEAGTQNLESINNNEGNHEKYYAEEGRLNPSQRSSNRHHYTLEEDLKIIDYIKAHTNSYLQPDSKRYWEKAIKQFNLLQGMHSVESLWERYRLYLCDLDEENKTVIDTWVSKHGHKGFLIFKKREVEDVTGQKYERNALHTIALSYYTPALSVSQNKEDHKSTQLGHPRRQTKLETQFENSVNVSEDEIVYKVVESAEDALATRTPLQKEKIVEVEDPSQNGSIPPTPNQRKCQLRIAGSEQFASKNQKQTGGIKINKMMEDDEIESVDDRVLPEKSLSDDISTQRTSQRFSQPQSSMTKCDQIRKPDIQIADDIEEEGKKEPAETAEAVGGETMSHPVFKNHTSISNNLLSHYFAPSRNRTFEDKELIDPTPRKQLKKPGNLNSTNEPLNSNQISKESHHIQLEIHQRDMQKVVEKADWVKKISKTYDKSPKELLDIFYYCSMNAKILEKYFAGENYLLWTQEEDDILLEGRDRVIKVLKKYKKPENVLIRQEFLKNYQNLKESVNLENLIVH